MISLTFHSVQVPVFVPNIEAAIEFQSCWFDFWVSLIRPPIHEVIEFPIQLAEAPVQPNIDPEDLPQDISRIHA